MNRKNYFLDKNRKLDSMVLTDLFFRKSNSDLLPAVFYSYYCSLDSRVQIFKIEEIYQNENLLAHYFHRKIFLSSVKN